MVEANDFRIRLLERGGQERTGSKSWIKSEKIIHATRVPTAVVAYVKMLLK